MKRSGVKADDKDHAKWLEHIYNSIEGNGLVPSVRSGIESLGDKQEEIRLEIMDIRDLIAAYVISSSDEARETYKRIREERRSGDRGCPIGEENKKQKL